MPSEEVRGNEDLYLSEVAHLPPQRAYDVMRLEVAIGVLFPKEISTPASPELEKERLTRRYRQLLTDPEITFSRGYMDEIIQPSRT